VERATTPPGRARCPPASTRGGAPLPLLPGAVRGGDHEGPSSVTRRGERHRRSLGGPTGGGLPNACPSRAHSGSLCAVRRIGSERAGLERQPSGRVSTECSQTTTPERRRLPSPSPPYQGLEMHPRLPNPCAPPTTPGTVRLAERRHGRRRGRGRPPGRPHRAPRQRFGSVRHPKGYPTPAARWTDPTAPSRDPPVFPRLAAGPFPEVARGRRHLAWHRGCVPSVPGHG
jgi:hypothetical protein